MEVHVASKADFPPGKRILVKCGQRNILVVNVGGHYFAIDNACYHHGGPLLEGEIENIEGHLCIVCPWHKYRITLDTGEGLYWGLGAIGGAPQNTQPQLRSKGAKQRVHRVEIRNDQIYCIVQAGFETKVESDNYAQMAIANREKPTHSFGPGAALGGSLHSMREATAGADSQSLLPVCVGDAINANISGTVKTFVFERVDSAVSCPSMEPGQWVVLKLPTGVSRTWTVTSVRRKGWFTTAVKLLHAGQGASRWLHESALRSERPLYLQRVGGRFTFASLRQRIADAGGFVLMISGGIGITPMWANMLRSTSTLDSARALLPLHVTLLHSERFFKDVPFLNELAKMHLEFEKGLLHQSAFSFRFRLFLTGGTAVGAQQESESEHCTRDWLQSESNVFFHRITSGELTRELSFGGDFQRKCLVMLCGPAGFMKDMRSFLTALPDAPHVVSEEFL